MISTAYFLTVKDVLYQRLHQTADFFNVIRHRPLLDAKLVRHFLLGGYLGFISLSMAIRSSRIVS